MPKLDARIISLRNTTLEAIQRLMDTGKYHSWLAAAKHCHAMIMERKAPCGFRRVAFEAFYVQLKNWKRSPQAQLSTSTYTDEDYGNIL